jgi:hypothetical protein
MGRIFPGAEVPVTIMAGAMEAGKLAGAAWLARHWQAMHWLRRSFLALLVAVIACVNAIGVFGQLSDAHLGPNVSRVADLAPRLAESDAKIVALQSTISDLGREITLVDAAADRAIRDPRLASAMDQVRSQRVERAKLAAQRSEAERKLVAERMERARIGGEERRAAADIGVLEYAASIFGLEREQVVQLLILAMVLACDPLSLTLVGATASQRRQRTA